MSRLPNKGLRKPLPASSAKPPMQPVPLSVIKRNGSIQPFVPSKLVNSISKAGATPQQASLVSDSVVARLAPRTSITSTELSGMTARSLSKINLGASKQYTSYRDQKLSAAIVQQAKPTAPEASTPNASTQQSAIDKLKKPDLVIEEAFVSDLDVPNQEGICKYQKLLLTFKIRNAGLADAAFECSTQTGVSFNPIAKHSFTVFNSARVIDQPTRYHNNVAKKASIDVSSSGVASVTPQPIVRSLGQKQYFYIKPRELVSFKFDLSERLPPGGMTPGKYEIKIVADPDNVIEELYENNNEKVVSFTVNPDYPPPRGYTLNLEALTCLETEDDTVDEILLRVVSDGNNDQKLKVPKFQLGKGRMSKEYLLMTLDPNNSIDKLVINTLTKGEQEIVRSNYARRKTEQYKKELGVIFARDRTHKINMSKAFKDYAYIKLWDEDEGGKFALEKINPNDLLGKERIDPRTAQAQAPLFYKTFGETRVKVFKGKKNYSPVDFFIDIHEFFMKYVLGMIPYVGVALQIAATYLYDEIRKLLPDEYCYIIYYNITENPPRDRPDPPRSKTTIPSSSSRMVGVNPQKTASTPLRPKAP